jgi:SAM-dependent methyltransferase
MIKDPDKFLNSLIFDQIKNQNFSVLDIGCGDGKITEFISKHSKLTIGIEPFLNKIDDFSKFKSRNLFFSLNSGAKLCFKDSSFDLVIFCQSLHHIEEKEQTIALKEAGRVLKTKGSLLIIEPMYNKGLYGEITAIINSEKRLKEKALEEIKKIDRINFKEIFTTNLKIDFELDDYNDFFNSKIKNKSRKNWNKDIEIKIKNILSKAPEKNGKLIIDNFVNVFCFIKN